MLNSGADLPSVPEWARRKGLGGCFFYHGTSMGGTFRPGDLLLARSVRISELREGDIVVFRSGETARPTVHRVIRHTLAGIVTRGDANRDPDAGLLTDDVLLGRVEWLDRGDRPHPVANGRRGVVRMTFIRASKAISSMAVCVLRPAYHMVIRSHIVHSLLNRIWHPRVHLACFGVSEPEIRVMHGKRFIGHWSDLSGLSVRRTYGVLLSRPQDLELLARRAADLQRRAVRNHDYLASLAEPGQIADESPRSTS